MRLEHIQQITLKYLGALGNGNILWNHILQLERYIESNFEYKQIEIISTPFFSAWIRMINEYVSNSLYHHYYIMNHNEKVYGWSFNEIIKKIKSEHMNNPKLLSDRKRKLNQVIDCVNVFIDLRHCFQHGGLPNISRTLRYTTPDKIDEVLNPSNFYSTKERFLQAIDFTHSLPKEPMRL